MLGQETVIVYLQVYEYEVDDDIRLRTGFEQVYGPSGGWAALFGRAVGYLGTDLFKRVGAGGARYVVLDRWVDEAAYKAFQDSFGTEYKRFGTNTRSLYRRETHLGALSTS